MDIRMMRGMAAAAGAATLLSSAAASGGEVDLSLRGGATATIGSDSEATGVGGLQFDLDGGAAWSAMFDQGSDEVDGGTVGVVGGPDGHRRPGFGGSPTTPSSDGSATPAPTMAPLPSGALAGGLGLAGVAAGRRRR